MSTEFIISPAPRATLCKQQLKKARVKIGHYAKPSFSKVGYECVQDLEVWKVFLNCFNSISFSPRDKLVNHTVHSDSAKLHGCGVLWGSKWLFLDWPLEWKLNKRFNIEFLELYPVWLYLETFKHVLENVNVRFNIDNSAVVYIVNKMSAKDPLIMILLRKIVLICFLNNIQVRAQHIKGELNCFADAISRKQWVRFRQLHPTADKEATEVPLLCHPNNFIVPRHIWSPI